MSSSPPPERRDEVERICKKHGARLCENETFYKDDTNECWALVEVTHVDNLDALLNELGAHGADSLVTSHERGKVPPPTHRKPPACR